MNLWLLVAAFGVLESQERPPLPEQTPMMVGNAACKSCHETAHAVWESSRHSKMVQPATPSAVRGDFDADPVVLRRQEYRFRRQGSRFFITESFLTGAPEEREVEYTLGNRRIQHYLTTLEDGRIVVLPPSWDIQREEWFHNLEIAAPDQQEEAGTVPVQLWNKNCFGCHVSDQKKAYRHEEGAYNTSWLDFGTTCERCHGPGSRHVDKYNHPEIYADDPETHIVVQTRLDPVRNSMVCAQCHSFRDQMAFGFDAGDDYFDYFFPLLEYSEEESSDPTWWVDGKTRRFSTNALGVWQSECFVVGGATCTGCHTSSHRPEIEESPQLRPENDTLCAGCHERVAADAAAHSFHPEGTSGTRCVECHMPRSVTSIRATMRDHSISIPSPENTIRHGIPNACNLCHTDESPTWAKAHMDDWWGDTSRRQKVAHRAMAYSGARALSPEALDALLSMSADEAEGPLNRANSTGHLARYLGSAETREAAMEAILRAAEDEHPMVRAVAALKLGEARRADAPGIRQVLVDRVTDETRSVRMNAAISLLNLGVRRLDGEAGPAFDEAKRRHAIRGACFADDASQQLNLGRLHVLDGNTVAAARAFEQSYRLDSSQPGIHFFMAVTRLSQSRMEDALTHLRSVPAGDPFATEADDLLRRITGG